MGFIRKKHVEEARARVESNTIGLDGGGAEPVARARRKKPWITVKETPDAGDIARFGALKVYRCVTTSLYHAREKARWVLFEELTYFMSRWEEAAIDVDQRSLTLNWSHEDEDINVIALADVPSCVRRKTGTAQADEYNKFTLAEFLSARREMVLYMAHDVKVRVAGSSPRQWQILEVRLLQKTINLIDVAAKFYVVFTEQAVGDYCHLLFLGAHHNSLRCIYAVALM